MNILNINLIEKIIKPWGYEVIWAKYINDNSGYIAKLLHINNGKKLSFQYHKNKTETIMVKSGTLQVYSEGKIDSLLQSNLITLNEGDVLHIDKNLTHRFIAYKGDVEVIEVSTTEIDDVVRISDDYGR